MSHAAFRGRLGNGPLARSHSGRLLLLGVPRLWRTCVSGPDEPASAAEPSVNWKGGGMGKPELRAEQQVFVWVLQTSLAYQ